MPEFATSADPLEFERQQRAGLARAMLQQGMSAQPIRHWTEGLARMAAALQGRMMTDQLAGENRNLDDKAQVRMADLLRVFDPTGQNQGQQPGQPNPTQPQPGMAMGQPRSAPGGVEPPVVVPRAPSGTDFEAPSMFGAAPQPQTPLEPGMNVRPQGGLFGGGAPIGQPMAEPPLTLQAGPGAGSPSVPRGAPGTTRPVDWSGTLNIPGFENVRTIDDFRANPQAQRVAFQAHIQDIDRQLGPLLQRYQGQTIAGVPINQNALRAMAHLGGIEGARRFVETGGQYNVADANGTRLADYGRRFAAVAPQDFERALMTRESSGQTGIQNEYGYSGLYQFGPDRLADLGMFTRNGPAPAGGDQTMSGGGGGVPGMAGAGGPQAAPPAPAAGNRLGFTPEQQRALMAAMLDPRQREQAMAILQFRQAMQPPQRAPVRLGQTDRLADPVTGQIIVPGGSPQTEIVTDANGNPVAQRGPDGRLRALPPSMSQQGGAFQGNSMDAQTYNILTNPNADPNSQEYGMAYWRATQPRPQVVTDQNGQQQMVLMQPNLPPSIRVPSWAQQGGAAPPGVAQPGQPAQAQAPIPPQATGAPPAPAGGPQPPASPPVAQTAPQPQQPGRVSVTPLGQPRARERPEAEHNRIMVNVEGIGAVDRAMQALQQYPNAIGLGPGAANTTALTRALWDRADPRGAPVRGLIANISSALLLARSGAAVTESEYNRLAAFLPTVGDNYELAMSRLQQLRREYGEIMRARYRATGPEAGYRPIPMVDEILGGSSPAAPAPQPGPPVGLDRPAQAPRVLRFNARGEPIQ